MTRNEPLTGSRWPDLIPYGSLLVKSSGRMLLISSWLGDVRAR
jgi:hypothetical protein